MSDSESLGGQKKVPNYAIQNPKHRRYVWATYVCRDSTQCMVASVLDANLILMNYTGSYTKIGYYLLL